MKPDAGNRLGRKEVAEGIEKKGWVLMSTDKSFRLTQTTKPLYGEKMKHLVPVDHLSSMKEMAQSEEPL